MWPSKMPMLIKTHCGPCGHLIISWNHRYLLWPVWSHSHEIGTNGLGHPNAMVSYLAVVHIAAHVDVQGSPSIHNSAHVVIAFSCEFLNAGGPYGHAWDSCSSIYPLQPWWSSKMLMQILMSIVAHVATYLLIVACVATLPRQWVTWAIRMRWYNMVSSCRTVRLIWPYRNLRSPSIHIATHMVIADWMVTWATIGLDSYRRLLGGHIGRNMSW